MHVLDYTIRRGMQKTAEVFLEEAAVCDDPIGANRGPIASPPNELLPKKLRPTSILEEPNSQKPRFLHFLGGFSRKSEIFSSCDISLDGNLVASAGFNQAAYIWHMDTSDVITMSEAHENIITDIRFNPCSSTVTMFATSSSDRTVRVWDAATCTNFVTLDGHATPVNSLDFHPTTGETLCSCTVDGIQLWNFDPSVCLGMLQGGGEQIRFQTPPGKLLAVATGNNINIVDVGTMVILYSLKGHRENIQCLCWDLSGNYIASVSEDSACVWSIKFGGQCIHKLQCTGQMFQTCIFNPKYPNQLVIGGNQILLSWVPENGQTLIIPAHDRLIIALAGSARSRLIASASFDQCVKVWS